MNYFRLKRQEEAKKQEEDVDEEEEEDKKEPEEEKKEVKKKEGPQGRAVPPLINGPIKRRPRLSKEKMKEMTLVRRWDVRISNISIENLYNDIYDPFIEFVIGGDFRIVPKAIKGGGIENVYMGKLGYSVKSDVLMMLELREIRNFTSRIRCEFQASYFDMREQSLRIDIWDWEKWDLNNYLGRFEIPLEELAGGDVNQEFIISKIEGKKKRNLCRINFVCAFQEIWDWYLQFYDLNVTDIRTEEDHTVNPFVEMTLENGELIKPKVSTHVIEKENNPTWPKLDEGMHFRGTIHDLDNQYITANIFDGGLLKRDLIGTKTIALRGSVDSGTIRADVLQRNSYSGGHMCTLKARLKIDRKPLYRQSGEITYLESNLQYLCVNVLRVDNVLLANDRGVVNTFVDVEWGGLTKRTRTAFKTYKPIFNDIFFFPIVVNETDKVKESKRKKAILNEFKNNPLVNFRFWAIDEQLSNDNLGSANFFLSELQNAKIAEKEFFDETTQSDSVWKIRTWSGKKALNSPFIAEGGNSNIYFDIWILYENEKDLIYEDLPSRLMDKLPKLDWDQLKIEWFTKAKNMQDCFPDENQRSFEVEEKDEQERPHYLPLYLCKTTMPNPPARYKAKKLEVIRKYQSAKKLNLDLEEDKEAELNKIIYFTVDTLQEAAYYVSLIPFSSGNGGNDIWCSPSFLLHMGKGDVEDHSILLASIFMAIKHAEIYDLEETCDELETLSTRRQEKKKDKLKSKKQKQKQKQKKNKAEDLTDSLERRTFVCVGSLKQRKTKHVWVMTIDEDYEGVTFWESTTSKSFHLEKRVKRPDLLKKFLNKEKIPTVRVLRDGEFSDILPDDSEIITKNAEEALNSEYSSYEEEESISEELDSEEEKKNQGETKIELRELGQGLSRFNFKNIGYRDSKEKEPLQLEQKQEKPQSYVKRKVEKEAKEESKYEDMVQQPRILPGGNDVNLPYRTIDLIFDNRNIYLNLQYFDPAKIIYDIFDSTLWHPFIPNYNKNFLPFYPPPVFMPSIFKDPALKLQNKLLKEIKLGISALRSGKNFGTSWKSNNDNVVGLMERHLIFLERLARGEITPEREQHKKQKWAAQVRQFMPKHYRFSAFPSHFNYPEPDRIRQVLIEEAGDYFLIDHKPIKFALAVKLFPYVGKVISIRVLVAAFYPIPILESTAKD